MITNLVTNPSFESNSNGWSGTSLFRSSSTPASGVWKLSISPGGNGSCDLTPNLNIGRTYTFSAYMSSGGAITATLSNGSTTITSYSDFGSWSRKSFTFVATDSAPLTLSITATNGVSIDAIMVTEGTELYDYFDGNTPDNADYAYAWLGPINNSQSTKTALHPAFNLLEFITSHNTDKVVDVIKSSVTVAPSVIDEQDIAYGKGFLPLPTAKWSLSSDFSTSYDGGMSDETENLFFDVRSNPNGDMRLIYWNFTSSSVTFYYTVYIFMPNDVDIELPPLTSSLAEDFVFLTNFNYSKVLHEGYTGSPSYTFDHNLGYYPQVEAWYQRDIDNLWVRFSNNEDASFKASPTVDITTSSVNFNDSGLNNHPLNWYIKVYLDEM